MKIAAYCRVSTDKADQLNSLEAQKEFFSEYTQRTGDVLVKLYADEGISGTKIKNRKEFLRMMTDAEHGLFDMVVVKDISRFARNTVDLLQNVRKLKSLGIETQFLTANMTSMGNSEFVLTIFGALAQEESANTSKRVKFGKKMNAEKGRVPNIVYGYDKTIGDYFNLAINKEESKVVQQIYKWYTEEGYGAAKIANMLNEKGYKTKRNCKWSQNATCRILTNEIYTGKIINGKQEVSDFLTGQRRDKDETEWMVVERPELRIIEDETFEKAQEIYDDRMKTWNRYYEALKELEEAGKIEMPVIPEDCVHNAHMFYIKARDLEERQKLIGYLKENGIISVFHYIPLHTAPAGMKYGEFRGEDKYTTTESERLLRLPMYYGLEAENVDYIAEKVKAFYSGK